MSVHVRTSTTRVHADRPLRLGSEVGVRVAVPRAAVRARVVVTALSGASWAAALTVRDWNGPALSTAASIAVPGGSGIKINSVTLDAAQLAGISAIGVFSGDPSADSGELRVHVDFEIPF